MNQTVEKLVALRCIGQITRLKLVLIIERDGGKRGLSFNRLKKKLGVNSNTLGYHLKKLVSANLLDNYSRAPVLKKKTELIGLVGARVAPKVIDRVKETRAFSYYRPTRFCNGLLTELGLDTPKAIRETLNEIEERKEYLKNHPIM